jgi:PilZ domain
VESFPTFQVSSSSPRPNSVLALPAHSIYSSQTQPGDQLVLCVAEEMEGQLQRLSKPRNETEEVAAIAGAVLAGAVLLREKPLWSGGPGLLELENRNGNGANAAQEAYEMELTQPGAKTFKQPRNWLQRWWSPDPRKAPRVRTPGLAAYYWNGSSPMAHGIRDISPTGLYVVTEERWYPGTLVLMTLQRNDLGEEMAERSIAVQSRAVRWGPDGVGLQFVLPDEQDRGRDSKQLDSAGAKEFQRFLGQLKRAM